MQFTLGQLSRHVSAPTVSDEVSLKRCIRYLHSTRRYTLFLRPKGRLTIEGYGDSDWACGADRKSVTGGLLTLAGATVFSWSRTQASRALSSCEAELYSQGSLSVEALWLANLLKEQGFHSAPPLLHCDSSLALALASRQGQERLKHVEVRCQNP